MGVSFEETVREAKEESGCTRGGERFQLEKRQRTGEGPVTIRRQDHERQQHRMK